METYRGQKVQDMPELLRKIAAEPETDFVTGFLPGPVRRKIMRELDYGKMGMRIRQVRKAKGWSQNELLFPSFVLMPRS